MHVVQIITLLHIQTRFPPPPKKKKASIKCCYTLVWYANIWAVYASIPRTQIPHPDLQTALWILYQPSSTKWVLRSDQLGFAVSWTWISPPSIASSDGTNVGSGISNYLCIVVHIWKCRDQREELHAILTKRHGDELYRERAEQLKLKEEERRKGQEDELYIHLWQCC